MEKFKVKFKQKVLIGNQHEQIEIDGTVFDKFSGISVVNQEFPSSYGGTITIRDFKITYDYYLILGDNGHTYKIECDKVVIKIDK